MHLRRVEADIDMMFSLLERFADGRADAALHHLLACMDQSDLLDADPDTAADVQELIANAKTAYPINGPYPPAAG